MGDFDYDEHGSGHSAIRRTDARIAKHVHAALGPARTVLNVGAGAGSYEPTDRDVIAVEPSARMRAQRPAHLVEAIDAVAEDLPFEDNSFDAVMATITVHQWSDTDAGLRELRRVSRGPVVILTFDGDAQDQFWLNDYVPELIGVERRPQGPVGVDLPGGRRRDSCRRAPAGRPGIGGVGPAQRRAAVPVRVHRFAQTCQCGLIDRQHGPKRR